MDFTVSPIFALTIFSSYFLLIFVLTYTIVSSIRCHADSPGISKHALAFAGLALASFAHTWYWMLQFMVWSFNSFESNQDVLKHSSMLRVASWLTDTALFEQAWSAVCMDALNWWWSEQLCLFTAGAFTVFLFLHRDRVPHVWAYMLLGQVVAISTAWSLFNLALVLIPAHTPTKTRDPVLPPSLTISVLLSLLTISLSPYTTPVTFLPNLLAMHALLVLPLLPIQFITLECLSPHSTSFYALTASLSILLRTRTTISVLASLGITTSPFFSLRYPADTILGLWNAPGAVFEQAWETLHSHPAQASIGWDVVWTSVAWLTWGVCGERGTEVKHWSLYEAVMHTFPTVVASVGVVAPMEFGRVLRENDAAKYYRVVKTE